MTAPPLPTATDDEELWLEQALEWAGARLVELEGYEGADWRGVNLAYVACRLAARYRAEILTLRDRIGALERATAMERAARDDYGPLANSSIAATVPAGFGRRGLE